jgi:hypothetical protein
MDERKEKAVVEKYVKIERNLQKDLIAQYFAGKTLSEAGKGIFTVFITEKLLDSTVDLDHL